MSSEACATCRFWDGYKEGSAYVDSLSAGKIGDCRRRAPRISDELLRRSLPGPSCDQFDTLADDLYLPSAFPVTNRDSWCGEYESTLPEMPLV